MKRSYTTILIPGLQDTENKRKAYKFLLRSWPAKYNITPIIFEARWSDGKETFEHKLNRLLTLIDSATAKPVSLSLIGASAGGSLAFNAYYQRSNKIGELINVCGRLRRGVNVKPSLEWAARNSNSFFDSVINCERGLSNLTTRDKDKILTMQALYDEIVPNSTSTLDGATNIKVFSVEHMLTGLLSLTLYSKRIIDFILFHPRE